MYLAAKRNQLVAEKSNDGSTGLSSLVQAYTRKWTRFELFVIF
jgi:hypothetical protein